MVATIICPAYAVEPLPRSEPAFGGKIAFSARDAVPEWPHKVRAPAGAPNIVLIMLDDVGFGDTSTFGGLAETPGLDQLAAQGLRFNRFHTTAICSPTRAALLSGRNHHRVGFGTVGEAGFPGYNGVWKKSTASVAEVLRRNGYNTGAFGKWHNTPFREITPNGPFDRWPTSLGFEYYYGNMCGISSQWEPELWRNTVQVEPPKTKAEGYHYTTDIVDEAIQWMHLQRSLAPDKPYFIYLATGAAHTPHEVPSAWIERYKGKFDQGWDRLREEIFTRQKRLGVIPADARLTPRPGELPAWDSVPADEKRLYALLMETYAAFIAHTDHEISRLVRAVEEAEGGDNTLILYIVGDNGAAVEYPPDRKYWADELQQLQEQAGPVELTNYAPAWAWAGSTPFPWAKTVASHLGGTRNPLVVSWPARIKDHGGLRSQFTHVNDVAPTLYEVAGIRMPDVVDGVKQAPLDGTSFAYTFDQPDAPSRHRTQYFEVWGNRAIYQDGWMASARHNVPWQVKYNKKGVFDSEESYRDDPWELYNLDRDFSQAVNLANEYPDKLKELRERFDQEARANGVYPLISNSLYGTMPPLDPKGSVYYPGQPPVPAFNGPQFTGSYRITAEVTIPEEGAEGVLVSDGSRLGGFVLYVQGDHLIYEYNLSGKHHTLVSRERLPRGPATLAYEFSADAPVPGSKPSGLGRLYINGQLTGESQVFYARPIWLFSPFVVGRAFGSPVGTSFQPPFKFTGMLHKIIIQPK